MNYFWLDASALVKRYVAETGTPVVNYLRGVHKYLSQDSQFSINPFNEMKPSSLKHF